MKKKRFKTKSFEEFISLFFEKCPIEDIVQEDNRYYIVPKDVLQLRQKISRSVISMGLFLGEKKLSEFYPSLALIELLSKHSKKKIFLDRKAEWLFLCGRDVFAKSIAKQNVDSGHVFVQNLDDENLGIGRFKNKEVINLLDKGDYLRREK